MSKFNESTVTWIMISITFFNDISLFKEKKEASIYRFHVGKMEIKKLKNTYKQIIPNCGVGKTTYINYYNTDIY